MDTLGFLLVLLVPLSAAASDLNVVRVEPGDDVTLLCRAADGSIRAVKWTKQGLEECVLFYSDGHLYPTRQDPSFKGRVQLVDSELKDGDVSLTLRNASNNDSGTYECRVKQGGSRRKRDIEPIRSITLMVTGGKHTGGNPTDENPTGGNPTHVGLGAVLVLVLVCVAAGLFVASKSKTHLDKKSEAAADEAGGDQLI